MLLKSVKLCLKHFSSNLSTNCQICVVGSGPAGFYFSQHLLKSLPDVQVDMYEELPVPFGLVRYGVAPDHPEVKNVINTFTKTGHMKNFRFVGNVSVGKDISLRELKKSYHAVVMAYGCNDDRSLAIKGEDLKNVVSARRFVGWYNGLPTDKSLDPDLNSEVAILLGQGNVAIDVARILLTPVDILKTTDITSYALEGLAKSKVKTVHLVGRRGPLHVAFTIKEFREMTKLPDVQVLFRNEQLMGLNEMVPNLPRVRKRLTELVLKTSETKQEGSKVFHPLFLRKPVEIFGTSRVEGIKFCCNNIVDNLKGTVENTDEFENLQSNLIFRSIGYKGCQVDSDLKFDEKNGKIIPEAGVYCTGWISTGPVGVIISTMTDAFTQAEIVVEHIKIKKLDISESKPGFSEIRKTLKRQGVQTVSFDGWEKINKVETERGKELGKPREKIVNVKEMLEIGGKS